MQNELVIEGYAKKDIEDKGKVKRLWVWIGKDKKSDKDKNINVITFGDFDVKKRDRIIITGRIDVNFYNDKEQLQIIADKIEVVGAKEERESQEDSDIPF